MCAMALLSLPIFAQVHDGPDLQWKFNDRAPQVVSGSLINMIPGSPMAPGDPVSNALSGEQWWYDIQNVYEAGEHVGYVASGFSNWLDVQLLESEIPGNPGCSTLNKNGSTSSSCGFPILTDEVMGSKLATVARYDLAGSMIWCKAHCFAAEGAFAITPSSDGSFVFTGWTHATRTTQGASIYFNPTSSDPTIDIADIMGGCADLTTKMFVGKVNSSGDLVWLNQYTYPSFGDPGLSGSDVIGTRSFGFDVIQKPGTEASPEYRVVGRCEDLTNLPYHKTFLVDLDVNGHVLQKALIGPSNTFTSSSAISAKDANSYYLSGFQIIGDVYGGPTPLDGLLFKVDGSMAPVPFGTDAWNGTTAELVNWSGASLNTVGMDIAVLNGGKIAWSYVDQCNGCDGAGDNFGSGKINIYDESDWTGTVNIDLASVNTYGFSDVHAFDLKIGLNPTADGGFGCITTIQEAPVDRNSAPYSALLTALDANIGGKNCMSVGVDPSYTNDFDTRYWNTNAYVGKFAGNGTLLWDKSFDADNAPVQAYPGDWKEQECVYRMMEADDGSLVFVGNTSHNKDDYYIAKIGSDCCLRKDIENDYDISYGADPEHKLEIATTTTWTPGTFGGATTVTAVGTIIVKSGVTLTIDGLTIEFADSRKMPFDTKLIVEPGAELRLVNGTVLTSLSECQSTMWSGVQVWGNSTQPQTTAYQGKLTMHESTIMNAEIGVACVKRDNWTKDLSYTGGILTIVKSRFLNNLIGIEMRPYKNKTGGGSEDDNVSLIRTTEFLIDGPLNDPERATVSIPNLLLPGSRMTVKRAHQEFILLDGIRGVRIQGNEFTLDATYGSGIYKERKGYGILAWDSRFKAQAYSEIFGDPSPDRNVFNNLWAGIYCKTTGGVGDVVVDGSVFNHNHYGVAFDGSDYGIVTNNVFNVPENGAASFGYIEANTGVYAKSATGIVIENNKFDGMAQTSGWENVGIYIEDSYFEGGDAQVYKNEFDFFDISLQTSEANDWLWVDCNKFDNDVTTDISVAWHNASGTIQHQGACFVLPEGPQANRFVGTHTGLNFQIYNEGSAFDYRHYSEPEMVLFNDVNVDEDNCAAVSPGLSEACPYRYASPGYPVTESQVGGLLAEINQLETAIANGNSNPQLYDQLVYKTGDMKQKLQMLIHGYLETNDYSSAVSLLESVNQTESSLMMLPILLETENINKMNTQITSIRAEANLTSNAPRSIEWHAICDFYELMLEMRTQQGGVAAATSNQINQLEAGAAMTNTIAVHHTNMLQYLELREMEELFLQPLNTTSQKAQQSQTDESDNSISAAGFHVFPNPAANEVRVQYESSAVAENVMLEIMDISGRVVYSTPMQNETNDFTIPLTDYPSGVYLIRVSSDEGGYAAERLIISK